jgi:hydrogenase maturation protease
VKTLVIGIGSLLRADDGAGPHVIKALGKEQLGEEVDLMDDVSGLDILDAIAGHDRVILVDAIQGGGGKPGTIYQFSLNDFGNRQTLHSFSTHLNMDFPTMLKLGKKLFPKNIPQDISIIAIEVEDVRTISDKCTGAVEKAIPEAVELIRGLLHKAEEKE